MGIPLSRAKKRDILGKIKVFSSQKRQIPLSRAKKRDILGKIKVFSSHKSQIPESQEKNTCYTFLKEKLKSFQAKKARSQNPKKKHMLYFLETKIRLTSHYPEQKNATYWEKLKSFQATKARSQNPKKNTHVILS